jgi:hypothetical protein
MERRSKGVPKKGAHGGTMVSPVLIDEQGRTVGLF